VTRGRTVRATATASRLLLVSAAALLLALSMAILGCSKERESLVGTWASVEQGETFDFRSDGTLLFTRAGGKVDVLRWQADDSSVAIGAEGGSTKALGYSIDAGVLTLTYPDEQPAKYTRLELQGD
jgi:hypothetical protein